MARVVLEAYLTLEQLMVSLDSQSDPAADRLRDLMDPLWNELSDEDRDYLNSRSLASVGSSEGVIITGQQFLDGECHFPLEDVMAA